MLQRNETSQMTRKKLIQLVTFLPVQLAHDFDDQKSTKDYLHNQLPQGLLLLLTSVHRSFIDILDCSCFHNVTDLELLNGLVLRDAATTVGTADRLHVSTSMLGASVITAFWGLKKRLLISGAYFHNALLCVDTSDSLGIVPVLKWTVILCSDLTFGYNSMEKDPAVVKEL